MYIVDIGPALGSIQKISFVISAPKFVLWNTIESPLTPLLLHVCGPVNITLVQVTIN